MFVSYEKVTTRGFTYNITRIFVFIIGLASIGCTIMILMSNFSTMLIILTALFWAETICTVLTFFAPISTGPNSALLNLPLLAVDLMLVVLFSNTYCCYFEYEALHNPTIDPELWPSSEGDYLRLFALIFVIARYTGLAWTNPNLYLKRLFCPIRADTVKEFAPYDPQAMMYSAPMPMPM